MTGIIPGVSKNEKKYKQEDSSLCHEKNPEASSGRHMCSMPCDMGDVTYKTVDIHMAYRKMDEFYCLVL